MEFTVFFRGPSRILGAGLFVPGEVFCGYDYPQMRIHINHIYVYYVIVAARLGTTSGRDEEAP